MNLLEACRRRRAMLDEQRRRIAQARRLRDRLRDHLRRCVSKPQYANLTVLGVHGIITTTSPRGFAVVEGRREALERLAIDLNDRPNTRATLHEDGRLSVTLEDE